ncbi:MULTISPECIES: hypothetical protein [unclassified Variovorax]|jgi:hypothetical protein|uniref:hypothetical protein n=1 Tax=unclassified Variovorax TaxID=663243 RepID=UPI000F7F9601|nr:MULTISPECIES: hypothetical protein [unclassified Variovorax]RSZ32774.1 hypothetical protein EJO70_29945 [Variovorax sp. 553]RSZ32990.1 hypothetical protein EJO71_29140 [Variovorax sp. 679]
MSRLAPPPIPPRLRDVLKDYPVHLEQLQQELNKFAERTEPSLAPFEEAAWIIESALDAFVIDAIGEQKVAEASGDPAAIAKAHEKAAVMAIASGKRTWLGDGSLLDYFSGGIGRPSDDGL